MPGPRRRRDGRRHSRPEVFRSCSEHRYPEGAPSGPVAPSSRRNPASTSVAAVAAIDVSEGFTDEFKMQLEAIDDVIGVAVVRGEPRS